MLRDQEQGLVTEGWEARLRAVQLPYLLGTRSQLLGTLTACGRAQALPLGSAGFWGGGDALNGWHWPGHPQQPLRCGPGDGGPQGNSFGASAGIQSGCMGWGWGVSESPECMEWS